MQHKRHPQRVRAGQYKPANTAGRPSVCACARLKQNASYSRPGGESVNVWQVAMYPRPTNLPVACHVHMPHPPDAPSTYNDTSSKMAATLVCACAVQAVSLVDLFPVLLGGGAVSSRGQLWGLVGRAAAIHEPIFTPWKPYCRLYGYAPCMYWDFRPCAVLRRLTV